MTHKILVVDDSEDMRDLMSLIFEPEGYEVAKAQNGKQALLKLDTESLPDLIFLDHNMSVMDGPEFLTELGRVHPELLEKIPIIMLTGKAVCTVSETRATEIIRKQDGIESLLQIVKRYLH